MTDQTEISNAFTHHAPKHDQVDRYELLRTNAHGLASLIAEKCPQSRERSIALTKLREVIMWANASIACNE